MQFKKVLVLQERIQNGLESQQMVYIVLWGDVGISEGDLKDQ